MLEYGKISENLSRVSIFGQKSKLGCESRNIHSCEVNQLGLYIFICGKTNSERRWCAYRDHVPVKSAYAFFSSSSIQSHIIFALICFTFRFLTTTKSTSVISFDIYHLIIAIKYYILKL